jgi:hypothetical protein
MWFLGAGASAGAGVPTAGHLIWRFKRDLYCSAQRLSPSTVGDLADERVQTRLQAFFESQHGTPPRGSDEEYSYFFEIAYPREEDRRVTIDRAISEATPSFGHRVLGALMAAGQIRVIWTTNFDSLVEDAAAGALGSTARLVVASMDAPELAAQALNEERYPLLVKLHGDFRSRRLRNTSEELKEQDQMLRASLTTACSRFGLAVLGYSGRDKSVMNALEDVLKGQDPFPAGLFWFHRSDSPVSPSVSRLIDAARAKGVEAETIEVETFDELLGDIASVGSGLPTEVADYLAQLRPRRFSPAPPRHTRGSYPAIRMNAFPLTQWPEVARVVSCNIGGVKEVAQAVRQSGAQLVATRRRKGVVLFGADAEARKAFGAYGCAGFDLYPVEVRRLRYESQEHGLLYEALARSLARCGPLQLDRWRHQYRLVVAPEAATDTRMAALRDVTGEVCGKISRDGTGWSEALQLRLEYRLNRLWVVADPSVALRLQFGATPSEHCKEFIRSRLASRYNATLSALLDAWGSVLFGDSSSITIAPFDIEEGINAVFTMERVTAFSWRGQP